MAKTTNFYSIQNYLKYLSSFSQNETRLLIVYYLKILTATNIPLTYPLYN